MCLLKVIAVIDILPLGKKKLGVAGSTRAKRPLISKRADLTLQKVFYRVSTSNDLRTFITDTSIKSTASRYLTNQLAAFIGFTECPIF